MNVCVAGEGAENRPAQQPWLWKQSSVGTVAAAKASHFTVVLEKLPL